MKLKIRLLNYFFGWDYIYWKNSADNGVARVLTAPDGTIYYFRYKLTGVIDKIEDPEKVIWLTCKPNKYGFKRVSNE